jgi:hypothetical protein
VEHFILECPNYKTQRKELRKRVGAWKIRIDKLLGDIRSAALQPTTATPVTGLQLVEAEKLHEHSSEMFLYVQETMQDITSLSVHPFPSPLSNLKIIIILILLLFIILAPGHDR